MVNPLLSIVTVVAVIIEIAVPLVLAWRFIRKFKTGWKFFFVGVATFVGSQVVHLPLVFGLTAYFKTPAAPQISAGFAPIFNGIVLGLLAGICEETARWVGYRLMKGKANSFGGALTLGSGHGGVESIFVGLSVLVSFVTMLALQNGGSAISSVLPADQAALLADQVTTFWAQPWYSPLFGAFERLTAITLHITLSVMVLQSVTRRSAGWFIGAVLYHALIDFLAVYLVSLNWSTLAIEAVFGIFMLINIGWLFRFGRQAKPPEAQQTLLTA